MTVAVIGTGLIGGSLALTLRNNLFCSKVIGVDSNKVNADLALKLNLVDKVSNIKEAVKDSDLIIIAVPVDAALNVLMEVLDMVDKQVVIDVGSTKEQIIKAASYHPKRKRFVATHPIWGTEFSGPKAAISGGFNGKITVICNREESDEDALLLTEKMYDSLGMNRFYMNAVSHDLHAAYVSHISHITSFALALSVLEKEKEEDTIFELAGGGFESTVRLAKSNPDTWIPIFKQNRSNILDVLNEQIFQLKQMKKLLEMEEFDALYKLIKQANEIKRILK
ncbi:MAG: prephenate dehydrogenase [Ignavibacteriaceae bacterium]|nr:prephenate dehydrogenase [Ignavibacteriaceae bacterium]